jgi:hypothetical protein
VEPEDSAISLSVWTGDANFQMLADFSDKHCAFYRLWAAHRALVGRGNKIFLKLLEVAGAALFGER